MMSSGNAIDKYWWMRASGIGWDKVADPCGADGSSGGSPSAMRVAFPESMPRICGSVSPDARAVRSEMSKELGCEPYG